MTDYGDRTPFLPFGEGRYTVNLRKFFFHEGFKGNAYRTKFIVEKSNRGDVKEGDEYAVQFPLDGTKLQRPARARQLRAFVAANFGADPADVAFDGNGAIDSLSKLSDADGLGKDGDSTFRIEIVCRDRQATDEDGKKLTNPDGSPKMFTNQFYNAIK